MRSLFVGVLVFMMVPLISACGTGAAGAGSGNNPNVIGIWELEDVSDYNALDAIRALRPMWLRTRSSTRPAVAAPTGTGSPFPRVHLNGVPLQDIQELDQIRASEVREMRFVSGPDASTRWGTGYTNGVILVITER